MEQNHEDTTDWTKVISKRRRRSKIQTPQNVNRSEKKQERDRKCIGICGTTTTSAVQAAPTSTTTTTTQAAITTTATTTTPKPTTTTTTTKSPTTKLPTSASPSTNSPSTESPTSASPTSASPSTNSPTTKSPSTKSPTTKSPSTESPSTKPPKTTKPVAVSSSTQPRTTRPGTTVNTNTTTFTPTTQGPVAVSSSTTPSAIGSTNFGIEGNATSTTQPTTVGTGGGLVIAGVAAPIMIPVLALAAVIGGGLLGASWLYLRWKNKNRRTVAAANDALAHSRLGVMNPAYEPDASEANGYVEVGDSSYEHYASAAPEGHMYLVPTRGDGTYASANPDEHEYLAPMFREDEGNVYAVPLEGAAGAIYAVPNKKRERLNPPSDDRLERFGFFADSSTDSPRQQPTYAIGMDGENLYTLGNMGDEDDDNNNNPIYEVASSNT